MRYRQNTKGDILYGSSVILLDKKIFAPLLCDDENFRRKDTETHKTTNRPTDFFKNYSGRSQHSEPSYIIGLNHFHISIFLIIRECPLHYSYVD